MDGHISCASCATIACVTSSHMYPSMFFLMVCIIAIPIFFLTTPYVPCMCRDLQPKSYKEFLCRVPHPIWMLSNPLWMYTPTCIHLPWAGVSRWAVKHLVCEILPGIAMLPLKNACILNSVEILFGKTWLVQQISRYALFWCMLFDPGLPLLRKQPPLSC